MNHNPPKDLDPVSCFSLEDDSDDASHNRKRGFEDKDREELVREETRAVRRTKLTVFFVIVAAGIISTIVTYYLVNSSQDEAFNDQFDSFASEIEEVSYFSANQAFRIISSFSKSITASVLENNNNVSFPFVTLPHWHVTAEEARTISGAEIVALAPLVHSSQKEAWEKYSVAHQDWLKTGLDARGKSHIDPGRISETIYMFQGKHEHKEGQIHVLNYHLPVWQIAGAPVNASIVNLDLMTRSSFEHTSVDVIQSRKGVLSDICDYTYLTEFSFELEEYDLSQGHPQSYILEPIFDSFEKDATVVAFVIAVFPWNNYFKNIFPENVHGVDVVIDDKCGDIHTYRLDGPNAQYLGKGDRRQSVSGSYLERTVEFAIFSRFMGSHPIDGSVLYEGAVVNNETTYEEAFGQTYTEKFMDTSSGHCTYMMTISSSDILKESYTTSAPMYYAIGVAILFFVILALVFAFDRVVIHRQRKLMDHAAKTKAIVSSLFPENVQNRLMAELNEGHLRASSERPYPTMKYSSGLRDSATSKTRDDSPFDSKPIADFFPDVTILFADLVGFTAWSSMREPAQVFSLLETLFSKFDSIARSKGVFKVETVGDCYVAATGLPDPNARHAVVMAEFSMLCLSQFRKLVGRMEVILGPDTADLGLRIGVHSGSVTAGVLRGEKSRFQLFGDTVNTASRVETTGAKNRIHISEETAKLLMESGLKDQITKRIEKVQAKGKGEMQTFWLSLKGEHGTTDYMQSGAASVAGERSLDPKHMRNVKWNHQNLARLLRPLAAKKRPLNEEPPTWELHTKEGETVLDEVKDSIPMPPSPPLDKKDLSPEVEAELFEFVRVVATMYRENSFHNFDHASHVTMSVTKLLSRISASSINFDSMKYEEPSNEFRPEYAFGITADPMTQFACAFSALIHDIDHTGVPNVVLVREGNGLAEKYKNKSVAEQNSVDLAWGVFMLPHFNKLRGAICKTQDDFIRFRALVVNMVMATDVMDKELAALRKKRWEKAFGSQEELTEPGRDSSLHHTNRKATIVIEHIIQASDVAHTMQHWHVYSKWNGCLFREMYRAYQEGRLDNDPSANWYEDELGFFDFYVIPLAKKLKECEVFGVASDEYLMYAQKNREEWALKGKAIVEENLKKWNDDDD